jgi:hypothetical protein
MVKTMRDKECKRESESKKRASEFIKNKIKNRKN